MTAGQKTEKKKIFSVYSHNYDHLTEELRKLDLLIQRRVIALRRKNATMPEVAANPRSYISHQEVDGLLHQDIKSEAEPIELVEVRQQLEKRQSEINLKVKASVEQDVYLALPHLAHIFGLSPFEMQVIIICLAPELRRKYDKLYVYLQDDITRKKPSVDLVLDLLCETEAERWQARTLFSDSAPLFRAHLLRMNDDPQSPSGSSDLARFLKLDPGILNFLLGNNSIDGRLMDLARLYRPSFSLDQVLVDQAIKSELLNLTQRLFFAPKPDKKKLVLHLHGPYGIGKRDLALGICSQLKRFLLYLDLELLLAQESEVETLLRLCFREGLLLQAALYFDNVDVLLSREAKANRILKALARLVAEYGWLVFIAGEKPWAPKGLFEASVFQSIELPVPEVPLRQAAWESALKSSFGHVETAWSGQLARQLRLTPGQIRDAMAYAQNHQAMGDGNRKITMADLYAACRQQSNQKLSELAIKIAPRYGWDDLVLPEDKVAQLKEICNQVKHRYRVFGEWGFDKKLSHGKGLSVLFSGPPGTGKTMAAEVIAHELQMDLYKIDLSGVVSKYIGETEKNLARIFHEAETSNAILFFDEADALFGKRTEVSDAHDRYANIETSYLLQKMEEYEGVVVLATNLRENMDEAFTRRIRFIVEFLFPEAASRLQIWKTHFPREAPVSKGIDYEFLSKQFQIAGGNIKNIVLNSAFLAAENGGIIGMEHILAGTKREFEKIGKLWNEKSYMKQSS